MAKHFLFANDYYDYLHPAKFSSLLVAVAAAVLGAVKVVVLCSSISACSIIRGSTSTISISNAKTTTCDSSKIKIYGHATTIF